MSARLRVAGIGLLLLLSAACGGEEKLDTSDDGFEKAEPSPSATTEAEPTPDAPPLRPPKLGEVIETYSVQVGRMPESSPEREIAQAYVDYSEERFKAYHQAKVDIAALAKVATTDALRVVQDYAAKLQTQKRHTVGSIQVNIDKVEVSGNEAKLSGCLRNGSADADASGKVVEKDVPAAYSFTAVARQPVPGTWVIASTPIKPAVTCS